MRARSYLHLLLSCIYVVMLMLHACALVGTGAGSYPLHSSSGLIAAQNQTLTSWV